MDTAAAVAVLAAVVAFENCFIDDAVDCCDVVPTLLLLLLSNGLVALDDDLEVNVTVVSGVEPRDDPVPVDVAGDVMLDCAVDDPLVMPLVRREALLEVKVV
jgi:hypothetical protein